MAIILIFALPILVAIIATSIVLPIVLSSKKNENKSDEIAKEDEPKEE